MLADKHSSGLFSMHPMYVVCANVSMCAEVLHVSALYMLLDTLFFLCEFIIMDSFLYYYMFFFCHFNRCTVIQLCGGLIKPLYMEYLEFPIFTF